MDRSVTATRMCDVEAGGWEDFVRAVWMININYKCVDHVENCCLYL